MMVKALTSLEAYLGPEYQGILIRSEEPWKIAVVRGHHPVTSIPLNRQERQQLCQTLQGPELRRSLVYFRLALRQANLAANTAAVD
ncbi:hypothetical protein [Hymenobacter arizonensis]|uniref:Uncharacterized protein n=1 Tax=Hymenobacter arizonensis TaxID=1227077 RepID=A0A1I6ASX0_HYMAR|nr:hypothetical protein [Hymenobacter arizonensis]SFQ71793.1 hypothetical protein SAMN04515668_3865 [Hymenobacter arizonensis]